MVAILENIRSVQNVGSVFRTADALGVEKLYLCGITPDPLDRFGRLRPEFAKISLGAEKTVAWESAKSASRLITKLKKDGFRVIAVEQTENAIPYYELKTKTSNLKTAFVFGNEVKGVSQGVLEKCDAVVEVPMRGMKESLNVAVTFGIVLFQVMYNQSNRE